MRRWKMNLLLLVLIFAGTVACKEQVHEEAHAARKTSYTCPMHPQIVQSQPGSCPICGMDLVPVAQSGSDDSALMLSERQIALGNIKVSPIQSGSVGSNTMLTGELVLDQTQMEVISSRAAGRVERLYVKESGQAIKKGQPLYELYSEQLLTLQREYLLALKQNQEVGQENQRFASFVEAARKKLLLYGLTEAQIRKLAKSGHMDARITFVASGAGIVTEISAAEGEYVAEGSVLYRLAKLSTIWVEAELYPQEIVQVSMGDKIKVMVQGFAQEPVTAKVTFISPELRAGSQIAVLRAELLNKEGRYLPGMQANVILPGSEATNLTLPTDAVIRDEQGSHVWVQTGENTFKARMVTLGEESADSVAILTGLEANEKVVTSGAYLLYSEFKLKKGGDPMAGMKM